MKLEFFNDIEKHIIYFLVGFVAMVSIVLLVSFVYLFMIVPTIFFGDYDVLFIVFILGAAYYTGKKVMKGLD
jgi:hypothetical protein